MSVYTMTDPEAVLKAISVLRGTLYSEFPIIIENDDIEITCNIKGNQSPDFHTHLNSFKDFVTQKFGTEDESQKHKVLRFIDEVKSVVGIVAESETNMKGRSEFAIQFARKVNGLIMFENSLFDKDLNTVIAADGTRNLKAEIPRKKVFGIF